MRSFILLLFIAQLSYKVHGKAQLLFANVTGIGKNAKVHATCVSDDYNDAISWTTPPINLVEPISAIESLHVNFNWNKYEWANNVANNATFGPVRDYTWEMFPIVMTRSAPLTQIYKFEKLDEISIRNRFEINLSFMGISIAHIYLCSNRLIKRGECIIFILDGWNGEESAIRHCKERASPINSKDKLEQCKNMVNKFYHNRMFLNDQWNHISIRYINQQLEVIINDEHLLSHYAKENSEFNNFTTLFIHSNNENAMWKYHKYTYYEAQKPNFNFIDCKWFYMDSNHLCISFFANFAKGITLQLYDVSQELIKTEYYKSDENTQWNYKTFYSNVDEDAEYYLRILFSPEDKIAIRNIIRHLDCKGSNWNNFHFSSIEYNFDSRNSIKCSSLRDQTTQLKILLPNLDTDVCNNQNQCNISTEFYNTSECPHRITCNENSCFCSKGYSGKYCEEECERGKYGCNCACECVNCISNFCSPVDGACYFGCNDLKYVAPFCKKKNLPVLTRIASTQMNCVTNCTITIYGNELKYDGVQAPKYYYTRLFQPNRTISEGELTSIKVNLIHFTNLIKEYKYNYQIVLCVTDQKSECFNDDLTTFEFKTTCEALHNDQILIKSLNRRTTINVTSYNSNINCFLHEYSMLILDEANSTVQYSKHLGRSNTILSLNIFTNYTLQLTKTHEITHNIVFTTDESVPNRVRNLTIISSSTSKLRVVWEAPIPVTGIITNYVVTWMLVGKRSCKNGNKSASIQSKNLTSTVIELDDLAPYSIYNISVSAVTKKGRSDIHSILGYTDPITTTETMQLNKFNHKITSLKTSLQIDLVVDCENWNGPIYLNAYAICKSEWCEGQWINATKHMQFNDDATINNLLPFTDYKLDLYQSYKNGDIFDNIYKLLSIDVKTLRTVPNQIPFMEIYSLSEISLSLRWSAPYPPTGILDSFIIKYHYTSEGDSTFQTDINSLSPCKIWPNMYCTTLTNLTANKNYIISIAGRNQISEYGLETILNETTLIKTPQSPLNLVINWDEFRFLQLQWQHPNKTNGPFLSFEVIVNGQHYLYQGPENTTYTFNAQFQCNPEIRHANVSIQTVNSKFRSALLTRLFICPIFKPSLQFKPSAIHNSNKSITISIPAIENDEAISNLYIVLLVTESDNTRTGDCRAKLGNNHDSIISVRKNQICWIIGHYEQRDYKEIERMEMNINLTQIPEFNCTENSFEVNILIVNKLDDQMSSNWYLVNQRQLEDIKFSSILLSLIVLTLIIIIIISILGLFLWRKKRRQENKNKDCKIYVEVIIPLVPMKKTKSTKEKKAKCSRPVVVRDFHEYVRTLANKPEFAMEYNNIVALTKQWDINLHRVKTAAECLDASYISNPLCDKAYILCSIPTTSSHYQFWKMIIDEKVENIVLFASMNDICNEKCEKYWPDYRLNKSVSYSDGCSKIKITTLPVKRLLSYDMHHFKIKQASTVVKTRFWHFTNCDKGGTLRHLDSFLSFLQGLQFIERSSQHPILVHSSCGLNASTDLFILLDICIRQAQKDEVVDICYQVQRLRTQRPNCIDTFEDYLFAHHILDKYFTMLPYTFADDHNSN